MHDIFWYLLCIPDLKPKSHFWAHNQKTPRPRIPDPILFDLLKLHRGRIQFFGGSCRLQDWLSHGKSWNSLVRLTVEFIWIYGWLNPRKSDQHFSLENRCQRCILMVIQHANCQGGNHWPNVKQMVHNKRTPAASESLLKCSMLICCLILPVLIWIKTLSFNHHFTKRPWE